MIDMLETTAQDRRRRDRSVWRMGLLVSVLFHLLVFFFWRGSVLPDSPMAAAGPALGRAPEPATTSNAALPEGIVAGIHAIVHSRLSTGATEGFRALLPEFMYFAVLPYFGAEAASAEMQAARV